ncbi:MAG: type II secretion system major pseudopilin GspG [Planctomycetota bacterium]
MSHLKRENRGFTLLEIMVVVVILGLLVGFVVNRVVNQGERAKSELARAKIAQISQQLGIYKLHTGQYPTTDQGLKALVQNPGSSKKWGGPYLDANNLKDPWGNELMYRSPGLHSDFDIVCYGADGREGGDNFNKDVTSWDEE